MWIFVADAFISVVAHPDDGELAIVRARHPDHIENLFPWAEVWEIPDSQHGYEVHANDYRYKATVSREAIKAEMAERVDQLSTESFRAAIEDPLYYDACARARKHLHAMQPGSVYQFLNEPEWQ